MPFFGTTWLGWAARICLSGLLIESAFASGVDKARVGTGQRVPRVMYFSVLGDWLLLWQLKWWRLLGAFVALLTGHPRVAAGDDAMTMD
jgi:hypothetical protein